MWLLPTCMQQLALYQDTKGVFGLHLLNFSCLKFSNFLVSKLPKRYD
jgi:hypothetical protein